MKLAGAKDFENLVPLARAGLPEEIAKCVSFLLSSSSSYVNGVLLDANGGLAMR